MRLYERYKSVLSRENSIETELTRSFIVNPDV